jgi:hypothetical protein
MSMKGMQAKVITASAIVMTPGVHHETIATVQMYAMSENVAVVMKTPVCLMARVWPMGMPAQQTAVITKRLNEAEPTMVNEPSGPTTMSDLGCQDTVRTARPRLVRVQRTYSSAPTGGEQPCAFGTRHTGGRYA